MATRTVSRNNLIAGSFVLAGIVLAVVMSIVISGAQERLIPTRRYIIRFPLATGTNGLKQGSSILLGGQPVGRVTGVQFRRPGGAATPPQGVDIRGHSATGRGHSGQDPFRPASVRKRDGVA
jgi:ABC-type transporter Mla subunit MlaD